MKRSAEDYSITRVTLTDVVLWNFELWRGWHTPVRASIVHHVDVSEHEVGIRASPSTGTGAGAGADG